MIRFILIRLWPALIPLLLYVLWLLYRRRRGEVDASLRTPLFWAVAASLLLLVASFIFYGISQDVRRGGTYIPPHYEGGRIVPSHIEPGQEKEEGT